MSTIAHDTGAAPIIADAGPHDAPYFDAFRRGRFVDLLRVPRFEDDGATAPAELTADETAIHDRDHDVPFDRAGVAIDHHDVVIVDAGVDHARSADAEDETRRPIEAQQLDQADGVILPILGGAWKAGSGRTDDAKDCPTRHLGDRDRLHQRQHRVNPFRALLTCRRTKTENGSLTVRRMKPISERRRWPIRRKER